MNLFNKDYLNLSTDELAFVKEFNSLNPDLMAIMKGSGNLSSVQENYRKRGVLMDENPFILNYTSLFPNNYLNEAKLKLEKFDYINKLQNFEKLLNDESITERDILNYIRDNEAYFLIGSVLKNYTSFGHHDRYLFKEFKLPPDYQADFLVVGKNSEGYHFLFFELENPYNNITVKNGSFGSTIRKGVEQINDWKIWLEKNYNTVKNVFNKQLSPNEKLPTEFLEFDSSRMNYVVVAGRRDNFNEKTYRLRRENKKLGIHILHYDNLIDESLDLIKTCAY
jgi:hypothetical protein